MPINNPINYSDIEDLGANSDLAKTLLRLLRDSANILSPLLNPTSINDAINLFKLFQNINLGNSSNFSGRLFNLLREFEEIASNTDLNNISSKLPENITPSPAETGEKFKDFMDLLALQESMEPEDFETVLDQILEESRRIFELDNLARNLNSDLGEGPSNYQDPSEEPYVGKGKGKAK